MTSDNPRKDGAGIKANVFLGNGLPIFACDVEIIEVITEEECDMAVAYFEQHNMDDVLGFDTENVAYYGKHANEGQTINKAALGQFCGSIYALMRFHLWTHCYASFARFMSNPRIEKVGNAVNTDVRKLKARFPVLAFAGVLELSTLVKVAFPEIPNGKLSTQVSHVLRQHLDKRIDHRFLESLRYTRRQEAYAANDASSAFHVAKAAARVLANAAASTPTQTSTPIDGAIDEDEQHNAVDDDVGVRVACSRAHAGRGNDSDSDAESDDEMPGERTDELGQAAIDADSNSAGDMDSHAASSAEQAPASRLGQHGIERYKAMITDYHNSARSDPMELPSSLTDAERMVLHRHAEQYGLEHRSQGPASVRCIVIKRWAPIQTVAASIGDKAVGALVARDHQGRVYRGYVSSFDRGVMRWEVAYSDLPAPLNKEMLDVDSLNLRMQRRFDYDHGENGLGEPGARPARGARLSVKDGETLAKLLAGVDENWTTSEWSYLYYDPAHWMRIFGSMLAVDKHSDIEKVFNGWLSETLFKLLPGEQERGRLHAKKLGMTNEQIKRIARKYWRRRLKYMCPAPDVLIKQFLDIYIFFRDLGDPLRPGSSCLKPDAYDILVKEMWYVQRGLLSDLPGMPRYVPTARCPATQFMQYRCLATASALEGMHFHYRQAQHPSAKCCSLALMHARSCSFDFVWNVKASVKASLMPDVGHYYLWLVDALVDVYHGLGVSVPKLFSGCVSSCVIMSHVSQRSLVGNMPLEIP